MKELELLCSMKDVSFDGSDLENVVLALRLVAGCGMCWLGKGRMRQAALSSGISVSSNGSGTQMLIRIGARISLYPVTQWCETEAGTKCFETILCLIP